MILAKRKKGGRAQKVVEGSKEEKEGRASRAFVRWVTLTDERLVGVSATGTYGRTSRPEPEKGSANWLSLGGFRRSQMFPAQTDWRRIERKVSSLQRRPQMSVMVGF